MERTITGGVLPPAEALAKANQSLADGHTRLRREIKMLSEENGELRNTIQILEKRNAELQRALKIHAPGVEL